MDFNESVKNFLESVVAEIGVDDSAAMFTFLGNAVKSNPGKLAKIATVFKDPETIAEIQNLANTNNKIALMGKIGKIYKKFS